MHVIVEAADPVAAAVALAIVCWLIEAAGHGECRPTLTVRRVQVQGRIL